MGLLARHSGPEAASTPAAMPPSAAFHAGGEKFFAENSADTAAFCRVEAWPEFAQEEKICYVFQLFGFYIQSVSDDFLVYEGALLAALPCVLFIAGGLRYPHTYR
jgi:hypothetical protein